MQKILFFLMLGSASTLSWAESVHQTDDADLSETFEILSLDDEPVLKDEPALKSSAPSKITPHNGDNTASEDLNELSERDAQQVEKSLKDFAETVGSVKTEKWYHGKHITALLERFLEKELSACSAKKLDAKACKMRAEKKIKQVLKRMNTQCAEEGIHATVCTQGVNAWLSQAESGEHPLSSYVTHWERSQKTHHNSAPKLRRTQEEPKSWWQSIKNNMKTIWNS